MIEQRAFSFLIKGMFQPSLNRYNTRSQIALNIPLRKTNTGQMALSFLGLRIWTRISRITKNVKTKDSFFHTYSEERNFKHAV